jgi:hypothetical protein
MRLMRLIGMRDRRHAIAGGAAAVFVLRLAFAAYAIVLGLYAWLQQPVAHFH